ncbi:death-associated protein 1-like [Saccoglossus kowalevskii]|uniref:Death-associated protein 1-like n=1 Tax=Saccoglossus kowalevskii TaxID=10224 RepID=A0ABM0GKP3_SACKO|nr:PREDICTED: death-associated protein 1-like [Saccoglossus kowalevskii]
MSSAEEAADIKGGHPPAVKAGGMRITQSKHAHPEKPEKLTKEEEEEYAEPTSPPKTTVVISGVVSKGDRDFPPEAVKVMHEKPIPKHDNRNPQSKHSMPIQQPRK